MNRVFCFGIPVFISIRLDFIPPFIRNLHRTVGRIESQVGKKWLVTSTFYETDEVIRQIIRKISFSLYQFPVMIKPGVEI